MWCDYELSTGDRHWRWRIELDAPPQRAAGLPIVDDGDRPAWTNLGAARCKGCPVEAADDAACPAAVAVKDVVDALGDVASIDAVDVVVRFADREVRKRASGAEAARSVFGLLMATSGCPVLEVMRPLARQHVPFATEEEFLFRLVGLHLLQSWFASGGQAHSGVVSPVSLQRLPAYLRQLQALNTAFAARLRQACRGDAGPNAMCQLFSLSLGAGCDVDDNLASLRAFVVG